MRGNRALVPVLCAAALLTACGGLRSGGGGTPTGGGGVPPPPRTPHQSLGPNSPPVIWLGGTLQLVDATRVRLEEDDGSVVTLTRLAEGATKFYRVQGGAWHALPRNGRIDAGQRACVETLMDGTNLAAIRVFLGSGCGPI